MVMRAKSDWNPKTRLGSRQFLNYLIRRYLTKSTETRIRSFDVRLTRISFTQCLSVLFKSFAFMNTP